MLLHHEEAEVDGLIHQNRAYENREEHQEPKVSNQIGYGLPSRLDDSIVLILADHELEASNQEEEETTPIFSCIKGEYFIKAEQ